jgi:hypothetical protein
MQAPGDLGMNNPEYAIPTDLSGNMGIVLLKMLFPDQA